VIGTDSALGETMTTTTDYQARKAIKIAQLRDRAANMQAAADREFHKHDVLLGCMNGTPVLVGHHSQKRHERDLDRVHSSMSKSVAMADEAKRLERRANTAEANTAISSDDPEALVLLRAKLDKHEKLQETMRATNKIVRSKKLTRDQMVEKCAPLGISATLVDKLLVPDFCGWIGFANYAVTNNGAEIRRCKSRIAEATKGEDDGD